MGAKVLTLLVLSIVWVGCATTPPPTEVPELKLAKPLAKKIEIRSTYAEIEVDGSHHEGVLQVPQPWIWGLSGDQKARIRNDARLLVIQTLINEAKSMGATVVDNRFGSATSGKSVEVWDIEKIEIDLDTYGNGYRGFGSAGNFWQAKVKYRLTRAGYRLNIEKIATLTPCPANLNANFLFNFALWAANPGINLPKGSYDLNELPASPVEIAARLAAREILMSETSAPAR